MFGLVSRKRFEAACRVVAGRDWQIAQEKRALREAEANLATARRERNQAMTAYNEIAEMLSVREDEITRLCAQIEAAKPLRDALGHFKSRKDAVMPEIAGRECSFVEREI